MRVLRRNLLPILVGLAAVLVSLSACAVVFDRDDRWDGREGPRFARDRDERRGDEDRGDRGRGGDRGDGDPRVARREADRSFRAFGGAVLGVTVQPRDGGVEVQSVLPESPAADAGVRAGDVIVRAAGRDVRDAQALREAVASARAGETYALVVRRDGRERTLRVERAASEGVAPFARPGAVPRMQPGFQPDGGFYIPPGMFPPGMMPPGMMPPGVMPPGMVPGGGYYPWMLPGGGYPGMVPGTPGQALPPAPLPAVPPAQPPAVPSPPAAP